MAVVKREQSVPSKTKKEVNAGGEKNKKKSEPTYIYNKYQRFQWQEK